MINLLGFIPSKFYKKKIVKRVETVYYYLTLFVMGVIFVQYSSINPKTVRSWLIVTCIVEAVLVGKLYMDIRELLLIIGMGVYYYIAGEDVVGNVLLVVCSYEFIKLFIFKKRCDYHKRVIQMICVMALGMFVCYKIDFLNYMPIEGVRIANWRAMWKNTILGSTVCAFYLIFLSCAVFWAIISIKQHICLSIMLVIGTIIGILDQLKTYTRMTLIIFVIAFCILCFMHFTLNIKNKKIVRVYTFLFILALLLVFAIIGLYILDFKNLRENIPIESIGSMVNRDGGIIHNVRFEYMRDVLSKLPTHLMGNIEMADGDSPHNVWICMARTAGIIPFVIIVIYSIISYFDCIVLLKDKKAKYSAEYLIIGIYIGLNLYYMIERAIESDVLFWPTGCMIAGAIRALWIRNNTKQKDKNKKKSSKRTIALTSILVVMMPALVSCTAAYDAENPEYKNEDAIEEYVDDAEYDDIALMGEGTKEDPYLINDYNDLIYLYNAVNTGWLFDDKYILQTNDIDMSGQPFWPIAEYTTPYSFLGTYDGGGHVIQNVCLYTEYYSAIFGKLGGTIMNLGIIDGYIEGWKAAGLVGICTSHDAKILNCYTITTLVGKETAGIVASASGMIEGCFSLSRLCGESKNEFISLGGDGDIRRCYGSWPAITVVPYYNTFNEVIWFGEEKGKTYDFVTDELNQSIFDACKDNNIPCEDFCIWKVGEDGRSVRLTTQRAEFEEIPEKFDFRTFFVSKYPYSSMAIGVVVSLFAVLFTIRINKK